MPVVPIIRPFQPQYNITKTQALPQNGNKGESWALHPMLKVSVWIKLLLLTSIKMIFTG